MASAKVHNASAFNTTESVVWDTENTLPPQWWDIKPSAAALIRLTGTHLDATDDTQRIPVAADELFEWVDTNREITKIEITAVSGSGTYTFRPRSGV